MRPLVYVLIAITILAAKAKADEPFVVLEYNSFPLKNELNHGTSNQSHYRVQPGDSLAGIVVKMYGKAHNNSTIFSKIVADNPHAFPSQNPNKMLSGVTITLPNVGMSGLGIHDKIYFF